MVLDWIMSVVETSRRNVSRPMVKFITKTALFVCFLLCFLQQVIKLNPYYDHDYVGNGLKKKYEKLKASHSPKIIFISGSSGANGINSLQMETALGMDVVNMAVFAGLSTKFNLEFIKDHINNGDIVIYSKEFIPDGDAVHYETRNEYGHLAITHTPSKYPIIFSNIKFFKAIVIGLSRAVRKAWIDFPKTDNYLYYNRTFVGDNIKTKLMTKEYKGTPQMLSLPKPDSSWILVKELVNYREFIESKKAKLFISSPGIYEGTYITSQIESYQELLAQATGIPLLNDRTFNVLPESQMYDGIWHPNYIGRYVRTRDLIYDLVNHGVVSLNEQAKIKAKYLNLIPQENEFDVSGFTKNDSVGVSLYYVNEFEHKNDNYIRRTINDENYADFFYYMLIKSNKKLVNKLFCRIPGGGKFDFTEEVEPGVFFLLKKFDSTVFRSNKSFFGISLFDIHKFGGDSIEIVEDGVYADPGDIYLFNVDQSQYETSLDEQRLKKATFFLPNYFNDLKKLDDKLVIITTRTNFVNKLAELKKPMLEYGLTSWASDYKNGNYSAIFSTNGTVYLDSISIDTQKHLFRGANQIELFDNVEIESGLNLKIEIDGKRFSRGRNGMTVVIFDLKTGDVFDLFEVDPYENPLLKIERLN